MVDQDMLRGYIEAMKAAHAATARADREKAEMKAGSYWFAMDRDTMKAALAEAKALKLVP